MRYVNMLAALLERLDRIPASKPLPSDTIIGVATELAYCRAAIKRLELRDSDTGSRVHDTLQRRLAPRYPQTYEEENGVVEDFLLSRPDSQRPEVGLFTETMYSETRRIDGEVVMDISETSFNPIGGFESYGHLTPSMTELEIAKSLLDENQPSSTVDQAQ